MSFCVRRTFLALVPLAVLAGQAAPALAVTAAFDTRLTDTSYTASGESEKENSSQSRILLPGLLLGGGAALLSFGLGGSGGGDDVFVSRSFVENEFVPMSVAGEQNRSPLPFVPTVNTSSGVPSNPVPNFLPPVSQPEPPSVGGTTNTTETPTVPKDMPAVTPIFVDSEGIVEQPSIVPTLNIPTPSGNSGGSEGTETGFRVNPGAGNPAPVPEPGAAVLGSLLAGAGMVWSLRRKSVRR
jgi:hypothetical protein